MALVLVAAGGGQRLGGAPKQLRKIGSDTVVAHALRALREALGVTPCCLVLAAGASARDAGLEGEEQLFPCTGGATRVASVLAGLDELAKHWPQDGWVAVHDAVRPCVRPQDVRSLVRQVQEQGWDGGALAAPVAESLHLGEEDGGAAGVRARQPRDRAGLWAAQTPQLFRLGPLREALRAAPHSTDELGAMTAAGARALLAPGARTNIKLTWPEDLRLAEALLAERAAGA